MDVLVVITPGAIDQRVPATITTAQHARDAGVRRLIVVSVSTADDTSTTFGAQFNEIEREVRKVAEGGGAGGAAGGPGTAGGGAAGGGSGDGKMAYAFARLPLFLENYYGFAAAVKATGTHHTRLPRYDGPRTSHAHHTHTAPRLSSSLPTSSPTSPQASSSALSTATRCTRRSP